MSPIQRAMTALASVVGLLTLFVLLGAGVPEPSPSMYSAAVIVAPQQLTPSAVAVVPTATATPIPLHPTATLARRDFNETTAVKVAPTSFLPGRGPALPGEFVYASRRADFYVGRGTFSPEQVIQLALKSEHALSYMQRRFAVTLNERISAGVYHTSLAPGRGTRGIAYTYGHTNVRIYYRANEDMHNALVILAHEFAHALQAEAYGKDAQSRSDLVLLEGLASWIAGEYWLSLSGAMSFQELAQKHYRAGYTSSLATMDRRNQNVAYDMWAGFVDYLTRTYGWDKFNTLYANGRGRAAGSANYVEIYGKSFQELQNEWYATLR
ncbi:hypothetical protein [Candidatus Chloroploca asiatica]|uniref:DUF1570 domain-containing protein n=1 Tax=Candidatus Chloroploca asiatica TaxID=1506545 RepID=A0A2H3L8R5_9CHLR|nr:hypothetical protein [Candidatus Chloroploca asiatica]PDV98696.1 hypothetical protein A9Q02_01775 [Candidatus Chloroploca asiatica]